MFVTKKRYVAGQADLERRITAYNTNEEARFSGVLKKQVEINGEHEALKARRAADQSHFVAYQEAVARVVDVFSRQLDDLRAEVEQLKTKRTRIRKPKEPVVELKGVDTTTDAAQMAAEFVEGVK